MSAWILENFSVLDTDGDGVITRRDIYLFGKSADRSQADRDMASRAEYEISAIGHVTDTITDCYPSVGFVVHNSFDISESDATTYPARVAKAYDLEFVS